MPLVYTWIAVNTGETGAVKRNGANLEEVAPVLEADYETGSSPPPVF
jgi:hypothetical protein